MSAPRFYCPFPLSPGTIVALPESVAHHAVRVLRLKAGNKLVLFDGSGGEYAAKLIAVEKGLATASLGKKNPQNRESSLQVTLVQALQSGDKMDMTVQKAVELGVSSIAPVICRYSTKKTDRERAQKRLLHWQRIAIAACEQCGRNKIPAILPIMPLTEWLQTVNEKKICRLMLNPQEGISFFEASPFSPISPVELLVGSEGGLSPEEISMAKDAGFISISLGSRILRTETAGLAALAIIQYLWGDLC